MLMLMLNGLRGMALRIAPGWHQASRCCLSLLSLHQAGSVPPPPDADSGAAPVWALSPYTTPCRSRKRYPPPALHLRGGRSSALNFSQHFLREMRMLLAAFAAVLLGACCVEGKVLGVDIGSENIKVTIVQPGRVPISIVTNEMSRRKSPGAVAFHQVSTFMRV